MKPDIEKISVKEWAEIARLHHYENLLNRKHELETELENVVRSLSEVRL